MQDSALEIAQAFVDARRTGKSIATYPGQRPIDLTAAYQIQDATLSIWNRQIGGWKVGRIMPPQNASLGADRLAGPVFADAIILDQGTPPEIPVFQRGFAAAEAEYMLRIAAPANGLPGTSAEAMDWIDEVRIGIEIASSPYAAINTDGPCVTISDHGNNAGLLLGPAVPRERWSSLENIGVEMHIDGICVGRAAASGLLGGPFGSVRFLLANLAQRAIRPEAGWWISSGAITGVHEVRQSAKVVARFGDLGQVSLTIG